MPMQAQRGGRGIAVPICNLGTGRGWVVNAMLWPLYHLGKSHCRCRFVDPRAVLDGLREEKIVATTGI